MPYFARLLMLTVFSCIAHHVTLSAVNGPCAGIATGVCVSTSKCSGWGGKSVSGYCPYDPNDIKCCVIENCSGADSFCGWPGDCGGNGGHFLTS